MKVSDEMASEQLLMRCNLQFFAKDGENGEKTEDATSKKLDDARKEGQVAKSKELVSAISLISMFILIDIYVGMMADKFFEIFRMVYGKIPDIISEDFGYMSIKTYTNIFQTVVLKMFVIVIPFFAVAFIIAFVFNYVQVKWKITLKPLQPKMSKISPLKGLKRMFSTRTIFELIKSVAIMTIISYIAYKTIIQKVPTLFIFYDISFNQAIASIGDSVFSLGIKISAAYLVIALVDYRYQRWKFKDDMKMTKQEVKDEYKNAEGDPKIKAKQRERRQQMSRQRMMQEVPKADVVITNPTHFAVAIKYEANMQKAPVVLAKGEDFMAQKIKEIAKENNVEIVENKPLARALYFNVDIGMEIPEELYQSVAEVLAFVYGLKGKK